MMGFLMGAIFGIVLGSIATGATIAHKVRSDLIHRGLAEYCATDGRFAFKGECGDE